MVIEEPTSDALPNYFPWGFGNNRIRARNSRIVDILSSRAEEPFSHVDKELRRRGFDAGPKKLEKCIADDGASSNYVDQCLL